MDNKSSFVDERCAFCEMPWTQSPTPIILSRWSEKTKTFSEKKGFCNSSCLAQWIESECYSDQG